MLPIHVLGRFIYEHKPKHAHAHVLYAQIKIESDFKEFSSTRLTFNLPPDARCNEDSMVLAFRRKYGAYRSEEDIPDKVIKKAIRRYLQAKPDREGNYRGVEMSNTSKDAKLALQKNLQNAAQLRREYLSEAKAKAALKVVTAANDGDLESSLSHPHQDAPEERISDQTDDNI
jgi:hypothetical protein